MDDKVKRDCGCKKRYDRDSKGNDIIPPEELEEQRKEGDSK